MNPVTLIQILKYFTRYKLDHGIHDMYGNIDSDIILLRVAEKCMGKSLCKSTGIKTDKCKALLPQMG